MTPPIPNEPSRSSVVPLVRAIGLERSLVWLAMAALFALEMVTLTLPFNADARTDSSLSTQLLLGVQHSLRPIFLTAAAVMLLISRRALYEELLATLANHHAMRLLSWRWLGLHLLGLSVLVRSTLLRRSTPAASVLEWQIALVCWALVAAIVLISWCCALLPPSFWFRWLRQSRTAISAGLGIGCAAFLLGNSIAELWWPLQRITFVMVVAVLHLFGQPVQLDTHNFIISLGDFSALIGPACSGVEGIALIIVAVAAYLWYARSDLKFPRALSLIPMGVLAVWFFNIVRIAALIWLGSWSSDAGVKGFHSVAGWLLFNLVACGLIAASSRFGLFARPVVRTSAANPATLYLLPLLTFFLAATTAQAFAATGVAQLLYLGGLVAVFLVLCSYHRALHTAARVWTPSLLPLGAGSLVALAWFAIERHSALGQMLFASDAMIKSGHSPLMVATLIFAALMVPLAEDLALRGYLSRRLIDPDFEKAAYTQFTLLSFGGTTVAFALLNGLTLPALLAGGVFLALSYRRGQLIDLIAAHAAAALTLLACTLLF